jgi:hypothetical protein
LLNFSHLAFASPWLLGFLAALPVLWWLLRLTPPAPKKILFPALALLKGLVGREETPARSPWWLLLLRLTIAALIILAFAKPLIDPVPVAGVHGALLIAIDNDWASARDWDARQNILRDIIRNAAREKRQVTLLPTAPPANGEPLAVMGPMAAEAALAEADALTPQPWSATWGEARSLLPTLDGVGDAVWLAGGLGSPVAKEFYEALQRTAPTKAYVTAAPIYDLTPPVSADDVLSLAVMRAATDAAAQVAVNAVAKDGNILARWTASFSEGAPRVTVPLNLPPDLRNRVARFELEEPRTAASVALLDAAWQHSAVGIVGDAAELDRHSLLSEIFYIDRALKPYADLHIDTLAALVKANLPVIVLTDATSVGDEDLPALIAWIKKGGILARFVGERFAAADNHVKEAALLPVPLRSGGRSLGGALTWGVPQKLQPFPLTSPFHNLTLPDDVTVSRQVLAEPSPELAGKTWAALADGTPLVTAAAIGQGMSILFHVPARSGWSNLPISGLFVDMLQRVLLLARADHAASLTLAAKLPPLRVLNAVGDEQMPGAGALPLDGAGAALPAISPQHPPGLYGAEANSIALNLGAEVGQPEALQAVPMQIYKAEQSEIDTQPYLLLAAFLLLLLDFFVSLRLRGFMKMAALLFVVVCGAPAAQAATEEKLAVELTSKTYLAYVRTGDATVDRTSEQGLHGLAIMLQNRTSIDQVGVAKVDPDADDLAFFPLLYWPVVAGERPLSAEGARRVTHYLRHGGMILFDAASGEESAPAFLQQVLAGVDLPPLARLPDNHVLKRSFYVLDNFPGRFTGHDFWLEPEEASAYDGVASVLYGSNGWAAAWAVDEAGQPLYPCVPDGEAQREHAFRFGINLVIYALTGNYKNDQVHTSTLLKKMGP